VRFRQSTDTTGAGWALRIEWTIALRLEQNRRMRFVRVLGKIFLVFALPFGTARALADDSYAGQPLTQVGFNHLIAITHPLVTTKFAGLRPTSYPVIHPGIARVHITEKLVHPMEQPLLRTH
jgi:hypothetical protein